jgi:SAM-dependent methyltransferase
MANDLPFDPCAADDVAAYVREIAGEGPPLVTRIHPSDEMYRHDLAGHHRTPETAAVFYFSAGASIFRTVSEIATWRFGGLGRVGSLLDFAAGYGRATRFFARALEPRRITVAEIDPGAVRFQAEAFGVGGGVSGHDPRAFPLGGSFDFVLAVSLFSHLPSGRFEAWLERLFRLVGDGGLLVFSTHGPGLLPEGAALPASGIAFRPESETRRLAGDEYGTTWVSEEFVRRAMERIAPGSVRMSAHPFGLAGHQDLYVAAKAPVPPERLRLARDPLGALDQASVEGGTVRAGGWAAGDRNEKPPAVRLVFGDRVAEVSPGEGSSGSERRWSFEFAADAVPPDRLIRIEAVSERGVSRILVAETLRPYLAAAAV